LNGVRDDGYNADSGRSRGGSCRGAVRPNEASKAAIRDVRNTSKPVKLIVFLGRRGQYNTKPPWGSWQIHSMTWMPHTHGRTPSLATARHPHEISNARPGPIAKTAKTRGRPAPRRLRDWGVRPDEAAAGPVLGRRLRPPSNDARRGVGSRAWRLEEHLNMTKRSTTAASTKSATSI
jgi:hypothetical protein